MVTKLYNVYHIDLQDEMNAIDYDFHQVFKLGLEQLKIHTFKISLKGHLNRTEKGKKLIK